MATNLTLLQPYAFGSELKSFVPHSPSDSFAATFLPEEGILTT